MAWMCVCVHVHVHVCGMWFSNSQGDYMYAFPLETNFTFTMVDLFSLIVADVFRGPWN